MELMLLKLPDTLRLQKLLQPLRGTSVSVLGVMGWGGNFLGNRELLWSKHTLFICLLMDTAAEQVLHQFQCITINGFHL